MIWIVLGVVGVLWLTTLVGVLIGLLIGRWLWASYRPLARPPIKRRLSKEAVWPWPTAANRDGWRDLNVTKLPSGQTPGTMRRRNRNGSD